jgi:hypothetical protein
MPALAWVVPACVIAPPVHVTRPLEVTVCAPPMVPPLRSIVEKVTPAALSKLALPLLTTSAPPTFATAPVKFAVPPLTSVVAEAV